MKQMAITSTALPHNVHAHKTSVQMIHLERDKEPLRQTSCAGLDHDLPITIRESDARQQVGNAILPSKL